MEFILSRVTKFLASFRTVEVITSSKRGAVNSNQSATQPTTCSFVKNRIEERGKNCCQSGGENQAQSKQDKQAHIKQTYILPSESHDTKTAECPFSPLAGQAER